MSKEEVKNNNTKENKLSIPLTITMTDASPEARWLAERSAAAGYVVVVVPASFGGWGGNVVILFFMHARTKGESYYVGGYAICWWERRTLSVVAHSVGYGGGGEKGSWCKL